MQALERHVQLVTEHEGAPPDIRLVSEIGQDMAKLLNTGRSIAGGRDAFLYESDEEWGDGFRDPVSGDIFVRINSKHSPLFTYGHEVAHDTPRFANAGKTVANTLSREQLASYKAYRDSHISSPDNADIKRELAADMFGQFVYKTVMGHSVKDDFGLSEDIIEAFDNAFMLALQAGAIEDASEFTPINNQAQGVEYSRAGRDNMRHTTSYGYLVSQPDIRVVSLANPALARKTAIDAGMDNVKSKNNPRNTEKRAFVTNRYSGTDIQITPYGIRHGILGDAGRIGRNSWLAGSIGDAVENAITVNELKPRENAVRTYLMMGLATDGNGLFPYTLVINETREGIHDVERYGAVLGQAKEYLDKANMKMEPAGRVSPVSATSSTLSGAGNGGPRENGIPAALPRHAASEISISNLLDTIKDYFPDGLSQDVLNHYGITRPKGTFSGSAEYSRITFEDKYGFEYSYEMPPIKQSKDGTYYADVLMGNREVRMEGDDRAALEMSIHSTLQKRAFRGLSRGAKISRDAIMEYVDGVSVQDYYKNGGTNNDVAKVLRGLYISNGFAQGGSLSTEEAEALYKNVNQWKDIRPLKHARLLNQLYTSGTAPVRLFEELGNWRDKKTKGAIAENYLEGERLADAVFGYVMDQGGRANQWMAENAEPVKAAYDGNIRTSTLTQMLLENVITEEEAQAALYDKKTMVVRAEGGMYIFDKNGQLKAVSSDTHIAFYGEGHFKRLNKMKRDLAKIAENRDPKLTDEAYYKSIRDAEQAIMDVSQPVTVEGHIVIVEGRNSIRATTNKGRVLADIQNGQRANMDNVLRLRDVLGEFYGKTGPEQNTALVENGYAPMKLRKNYAPHMSRETYGMQDFIATLRGDDQDLPTPIAGLTSAFKPGRPYTPHLLQRVGQYTEYDAMRGFDRYVTAAANLIHYMPATQRVRQMERFVRENSNLHKNGALANFLHSYANSLANKKSDLDRGIENIMGREVYTISDAATKAMGASAVAGSFSSALSNNIALLSAIPTLDKSELPKAVRDTWRNGMGIRNVEEDDFANRLSFLSRRFNEYERILSRRIDKNLRKGSRALGFMFQFFDRFASETVARAKYQELRKKGFTDAEALSRTNNYCIKLFADRSKGMSPMLFGSKLLKPFIQFQLEALNQMSHFRDINRQGVGEQIDELIAKNNGVVDGIDWAALENQVKARTPKGVRRKLLYLLLMSLWSLLVTRPLFNRTQTVDVLGTAYDMARKAADGGDAKDVAGVALDAAADQLPFTSMFVEGGRVPAISILDKFIKIAGEDKTIGERARAGLEAGLSIVPGGGQANKIIRGVEAVAKEGYYSDSGKLRYPVAPFEQAPWDATRAMLFGPTALLPEDFDYTEDTLSESQTANYKKLTEAGISQQDAYKLLRDMDGTANYSKAGSIALHDKDKDGTPDFSESEMNHVAMMLGIEIPKNKTVPQYTMEEAERYIQRQRKDKNLPPEKLAEKEDEVAELMGWMAMYYK